NRPAPGPQRSPGLVHLAPAPPAPRQNQPLPAKTGQIQRSAAGVLTLQQHLCWAGSESCTSADLRPATALSRGDAFPQVKPSYEISAVAVLNVRRPLSAAA